MRVPLAACLFNIAGVNVEKRASRADGDAATDRVLRSVALKAACDLLQGSTANPGEVLELAGRGQAEQDRSGVAATIVAWLPAQRLRYHQTRKWPAAARRAEDSPNAWISFGEQAKSTVRATDGFLSSTSNLS